MAPLAHRALAADPHIGLLLPCSGVGMEAGDATTVSIADACAMFRIVENAEVAPIADEAEAKLTRETLGFGPSPATPRRFDSNALGQYGSRLLVSHETETESHLHEEDRGGERSPREVSMRSTLVRVFAGDASVCC